MDTAWNGDLPPEAREIYEASGQVPWLLGIGAFLACSALGFVCLWNPEGVWEIRHAFDTAGGAPTRGALVCTRILGGALVLAGIFCIISDVGNYAHFPA